MSSNEEETTNICTRCGATFLYRIPWKLCSDCEAEESRIANQKAQREAEEAARARFWSSVPPLYSTTNKTRLSPVLRETLDSYQYGPMGVAFLGEAGSQKTRAAVLLLEQIHDSGKSTLFLSCTALATAAANSFSNSKEEQDTAKAQLRKAYRCDALLLDDIGKNRMTERAEVTLYELLEHRTSHLLPTIWTSNSNAAGLHSMFAPDRADAIVRRLGKEFCTHITT